MSATDGHERLELGLIGDEGMQGASLVLGVAESCQCALVQGAGPALRIGAIALRRELKMAGLMRAIMPKPCQRRSDSTTLHLF